MWSTFPNSLQKYCGRVVAAVWAAGGKEKQLAVWMNAERLTAFD